MAENSFFSFICNLDSKPWVSDLPGIRQTTCRETGSMHRGNQHSAQSLWFLVHIAQSQIFPLKGLGFQWNRNFQFLLTLEIGIAKNILQSISFFCSDHKRIFLYPHSACVSLAIKHMAILLQTWHKNLQFSEVPEIQAADERNYQHPFIRKKLLHIPALIIQQRLNIAWKRCWQEDIKIHGKRQCSSYKILGCINNLLHNLASKGIWLWTE